jgi:hypothetical protein
MILTVDFTLVATDEQVEFGSNEPEAGAQIFARLITLGKANDEFCADIDSWPCDQGRTCR